MTEQYTREDPRVLPVARSLGNCLPDETPSNDFITYAEEALAAADFVDPLRQPGHVLDLREDAYSLQHPPECRPDLLHCSLQVFMQEIEKAPALPGRYRVQLDDDGTLHLEDIADGLKRCAPSKGLHATPHVGCILR